MFSMQVVLVQAASAVPVQNSIVPFFVLMLAFVVILLYVPGEGGRGGIRNYHHSGPVGVIGC